MEFRWIKEGTGCMLVPEWCLIRNSALLWVLILPCLPKMECLTNLWQWFWASKLHVIICVLHECNINDNIKNHVSIMYIYIYMIIYTHTIRIYQAAFLEHFPSSPGAVSGRCVPTAERLDPGGRRGSVPARGGLVQGVGMQPGGPVESHGSEPWDFFAGKMLGKWGGNMVDGWRLN